MKKTYINTITPATPTTRRMFRNLSPKGQWFYNFYINRGREVLGWFWEPSEALKEAALDWALLAQNKSLFRESDPWNGDWDPEKDADEDIRFLFK